MADVVDVVTISTGEKVKVGKPTSVETEYVILERDDTQLWSERGVHVAARSAEAAIRSLDKAGTYAAIPARSWKPVMVKAETKTVLTLGEAS